MPGGGASRLVLIRHGETSWNAEGRWQGQTGVGLNERGRRQAEATAAHVAAAVGDVALLVRSDALRVEETSAPLEALLGVPVRVDPRLREIDVGTWSGRTRVEVESADPDGWAAYRRQEPIAIGGGETVAQLRDRMVAALRDVVAAAEGRSAVVVSHGWALRVGIAGLLGVHGDDEAALGRLPNGSVSVLELRGGTAALAAYAEDGHLGELGLASGRRSVAERA